ncbi:type II toxin-antitoxin system HicB family antitoxin [Coleofasciculus sp. H7-2]|uniref:type II toxin-antitoxin system HicB family antitoxin n=1 Tax=Coleofasciculus sp. H7-2 TaxID=3351545 RepID=UPI003671BF23
MRYKVQLHKTEEGYAVWCPSLPGCWSQGETEDEALENIKDAIQVYLDTVDELAKDSEFRYVEVG